MQTVPLMLAELEIGSPQWIGPALVLGVGLTFLVLWNYARSGGRRVRSAWLGVALKLAAIALLTVCLLEPMRRAERPRPRANLLPILVDTSGSMELKWGRSAESWRDRIDKTLAPDSPILAPLAQNFETRLYGFDNRLASVGEVADLSRGGTGSRLIENLDELATRLAERPVAGVLLMTDGNVPHAPEDLERLADVPFPIYPVLAEQDSGLNDLRVAATTVRQTNFEISPVTLAAQLELDGALAGEVTARLTDVMDETVVEQKTVALRPGETDYRVAFQFRPADVGLRFYRLDVFRDVDQAAFDAPATLLEQSSSETTLVNNTRLVAVDRRGGPYRVLYVAGRPNWEFKFLRRAIQEDAEVELTGLIRMANKEPKFSFRDQAVSDANPLFQGFDEEAEETAEQYDEPVMIRIGVKESEELAAGFPKTEDLLFEFDALILDDLEPQFFSRDQLEMIRRFVSARGGGLMMLGGQEMFRSRDFADTALGDLSPVYLGRSPAEASSDYSMGLTREGMLQPWMRLRETVADETKRLRRMPKFSSANAVGSLKPGAYQLATVRDAGGENRPAMAIQRFGKGKVGALTIADLWRWSMQPDPERPDDAAQAWRQITRWLVGDVPRRVELTVRQRPQDHAAVLRIETRDESFAPLENPELELTVARPGRDPISLRAEPDPEQPGVFVAEYYDETPGEYVAEVQVNAADGQAIGSSQAGWTRQIAGNEFDRLGINRPLLEQIARQSGGQLIGERDLDDFSNRLNTEKVPMTEVWKYPLWHRGWVIALALGCLCGEWALRRWRGLA